MSQEPRTSPADVDQKVALLRSRFFNREDQVAAFMRWDRPHPIQAGDDLDALLRAHVEGESAPKAVARFRSRKGGMKVEKGWYRIGSYAPDADDKTRWLCLDFDGPGHSEPLQDPQGTAVQALRNAEAMGLPAYLERSGGGNGWHVWVFFEEPIPARDARKLGAAIAPTGALLANGGEASARSNRGIEVFPKQERHRKKKGLGNLLWLPFWHGATEGANQFHRLDGDTPVPFLPDALDVVTPEALEAALQAIQEPEATLTPPNVSDTSSDGASASSRSTTDEEAVEEYLRRVGPDDDAIAPPSNDWREWRRQALAALPIEDIYGDLLTGEVSGENWLQCRDPESPSGVDSRSGSVADGNGEAPRGTFHSWRTNETMSVFDFMVRRGVASDFSDALRKVAQLSGVPLPTPPAAAATPPASTPPPTPPPPASSGYPTIVVNNRQLRDIIWDSWQALLAANAQRPFLFRRSGRPVHVVMAGEAPQLEFIEEAVMYGILARRADWVKRNDDGDQDTMPPPAVARDLVSITNPDLPPLEAVVTAPVFDRRGALVAFPGYHPDAALWYHELAGFSLPPVPDAPTSVEVARARSLILDELFVDFPFVSESDRAHAVAALLLPFVRRLVPGPTPVHLFEASTPGSGKTLLAEVIYLVSTGERADPTTLGRDDEETRKKITSVLVLGRPVVLIDNVRDGIDSANLASALTAENWQDRLLGQNTLVRLPNRAVWLVTANNPTLTLEMARRSVRIRIEPTDERPWQRDNFRHSPLKLWVNANRGDLVWAVLVLVQAWLAGGSPSGKRTLGSFENWAAVIGGILEAAGIQGFLDNANDLYEAADVEGQEWREFVPVWWEEWGRTPVAAGTLLQLARDRNMLLGVLGTHNERSQATRLGKALRSNRDRKFDGYRIAGTRGRTNQNLWKLVDERGDKAADADADVFDLFNPPPRKPRVQDVNPTPRGITQADADGRADAGTVLTHASVSASAHTRMQEPRETSCNVQHVLQEQENQAVKVQDVGAGRHAGRPARPARSPETDPVDLADLDDEGEDDA